MLLPRKKAQLWEELLSRLDTPFPSFQGGILEECTSAPTEEGKCSASGISYDILLPACSLQPCSASISWNSGAHPALLQKKKKRFVRWKHIALASPVIAQTRWETSNLPYAKLDLFHNSGIMSSLHLFSLSIWKRSNWKKTCFKESLGQVIMLNGNQLLKGW